MARCDNDSNDYLILLWKIYRASLPISLSLQYAGSSQISGDKTTLNDVYGNHLRNLPRFCEDFVALFSALPEVGWEGAKKCKLTHAIWEGFISDSLYRVRPKRLSPGCKNFLPLITEYLAKQPHLLADLCTTSGK